MGSYVGRMGECKVPEGVTTVALMAGESQVEVYLRAVKTNVEEAIHGAGFPGYYVDNVLTVEHLARIAEVLGINPADFFPPFPVHASERCGSQPQDRRPAS